MIKTLLVGAALGFVGKKLYDDGQLDPFIAKAKEKVDELVATQPLSDKSRGAVAKESVG